MSSNIRKLKLASLGKFATPFNSFNQYIDSSGSLIFQGKAKITSSGVSFEDGACFNINKENIQVLSHLGKGQYGIVNKCIYSPTSKIMAVKEIRLELNQIKLNQIIMELDVLHKSLNCPYIVDFFGAYFVDGCVYYCMEFMVLFFNKGRWFC